VEQSIHVIFTWTILRWRPYSASKDAFSGAHQRQLGDALKKLLWKIQDELISMNYEDRESLEMRWFEGDILAVQEHVTEACDLNGDGVKGEMKPIDRVDFQKKYAPRGPDNPESPELSEIFGLYETEFQRIIYRRFKHLYSTRWTMQVNPQELELETPSRGDRATIDGYLEEERVIEKEFRDKPNARLVIPDHRIRRLQHLLSDLVVLLDEASRMKFNRPTRRHGASDSVPCDCHSIHCNPEQKDFQHRQLDKINSGYTTRPYLARRTPTWSSTLTRKKTKE